MRRVLVLLTIIAATTTPADGATDHTNMAGGDQGGGCPYANLTYLGTWDGWTWYCQNYGIIPGWRVTG